MPTIKLTDRFCHDAAHPDAGQQLYFDTTKGTPRGFALRVTAGSKAFVLNYTRDGRQRRLTLGPYPALSLAAARAKATAARGDVARGGDPVADKRRARVEADQHAQAERAAREHTLTGLLAAYVSALEESGKNTTAAAVRGMVRLHLEEAHPAIAARPAAAVEPEDIVVVLSPLIRARKLRTAGKLRSYLRAAYAAAKRSRLDAEGSPALRDFGLRVNPVAEVAAVTEGNQARDRALSVAELRAYWNRAKNDPLLALHFLTGAQRIEQLSRATVADLDADARTLRILDAKGRRSKPRVHIVPLLPEAEAAIAALEGTKRRGAFVFSATAGATAAGYDTLRTRLAIVAEAMREAGELERGPFTPGDLRRTVETRLAAEGVREDVRARLQSHGLGGVQSRHYDRHDYQSETRAALETLLRIASSKAGTVTPIRRARRGAK